jgi:hypothetical protein
MLNNTKLLTASAITLMANIAVAGEGHTIFNPTPAKEMRPMTTERPSKTDGPYSLDAGHIQIETNLLARTQNNDCVGGTCTKTSHNYLGGTNNLRIGLTDTIDLQIINDIYHSITTKTSGTKETREGFGDTTLRLKANLLGNNPSDKYSLALLPYVKIPTNQDHLGNNKYEGGVELPFNVNLPNSWSIGGMTAISAINQLDNSGHDAAYANSLILGKGFTDKWSGYTEIFTYKADQSGAKWQNTLDFGTVYAVTDNVRIDTGVNFGITDAADDLNYFVGFAYRF